MKEKDPYEHIICATDSRLAEMLQEYARRHVDDEKETLLEAARRLKLSKQIPFNDEAFRV